MAVRFQPGKKIKKVKTKTGSTKTTGRSQAQQTLDKEVAGKSKQELIDRSGARQGLPTQEVRDIEKKKRTERAIPPEEEQVPTPEIIDIDRGKRDDLVKITQVIDGVEVPGLEGTPEQMKFFDTKIKEGVDMQAKEQGLTPFSELPAYQQILAGIVTTGGAGAIGGFVTTPTKVQKAAQIGKIEGQVFGTAERFAVNGKATAQTTTWIGKLAQHLQNPTAIAGTLVATIGSYPFAGFIKEEALQTLDFAGKAAKDAGNLEGEEVALQTKADLLDPGLWDSIMAKIPYANILNQLSKFYDAARKKLIIDAKDFEQRKQASVTT